MKPHGYTVVAKYTTTKFVDDLKREATFYKRLSQLQGSHIPIYLSNLDLAIPYYYKVDCQLVHMMLLSFGRPLLLSRTTAKNSRSVAQLAQSLIQAIYDLDVLHKDIAERNMLWNEERKGVMLIGFRGSGIGQVSPCAG